VTTTRKIFGFFETSAGLDPYLAYEKSTAHTHYHPSRDRVVAHSIVFGDTAQPLMNRHPREIWRTPVYRPAHRETGSPRKHKRPARSTSSLSRFGPFSWRRRSDQSIDNARSNFLLSLRESARIFSTAGRNWAKKKIPAHASVFAMPGKFFREGMSKRPEMSSRREKSEKAKTMKGN